MVLNFLNNSENYPLGEKLPMLAQSRYELNDLCIGRSWHHFDISSTIQLRELGDLNMCFIPTEFYIDFGKTQGFQTPN